MKVREAPGARWIVVGRAAAALAADRLAPGVRVERVDGVHEALALLVPDRYAGCVTSPDALATRPRAAIRRLRERAGRARIAVLAGSAPERILRAARALGVEVWTDADPLLAPPSASPPLPRADREPSPASPDPAEFADGCLRRIGRPGPLARFVLRSLVRLTGAGRVTLLLREVSRPALRLRAAHGFPPGLVGRVRCPLASGLPGRVVTHGRPVLGHASAGGPRAYAGTAFAVLPLGRNGRVGVACLTDLPGDRLPDPAALARWRVLADRAGTAIESARRLRRAEALSSMDPLTGLPNRRAFERALAREVERARRSGSGLAVALLDLDRFKGINDRYGHPAGDRALIQTARRIHDALRETDMVARYGGEEFAILLPGISAEEGSAEALRGVERARSMVARTPLVLGPGLPPLSLTLSGGVALYPRDARDGPGLVRAADQALYRAKEGGRDRVLSA